MPIPPLPSSWSVLTWQQLCDCWTAKLRYGGNPDAARCAALLTLLAPSPHPLPARGGSGYRIELVDTDPNTGEQQYLFTPLHTGRGSGWVFTPRQLAHLAKQALPWFNFPYGDPGEPAVKDEKGKVTKEGRDPVHGYVNPNWRDAMQLSEERVVVCNDRTMAGSEWDRMSEEERQQILHSSLFTLHFALPDLACTNLVWHQYRSLQGLTQQMFQDGITDDAALELQAQFLAYCLVPEQQAGNPTDRFARQHRFKYDADRAEQSVGFWRSLLAGADAPAAPLYAICFQVYQTAMHYYEQVFPLLFSGGGKSDPLHDALTGEVDTINSVMKYQGYTDPQQVYDANLPIILSVLNTMTKEAKEIEKMNAKVKRK